MNIAAIALNAAPGQSSASSPQSEKDDKIGKAAAQFESLFLTQMLRSAHASGGWLSDGEESNQTMMELGEEQIAQALADSGGLGLGKTIADSLRTQTTNPPPTAPTR